MTVGFNLISEPWIPVLFAGENRTRDVSLHEALARAPDIGELVHPSPLVTVALHRLLLAVCHRIYGPETEDAWEQLWNAGRFEPGPLETYLDAWKHRFELFDEERPFYQAPGLPESIATTIAKLGHEYAAGNNAVLFDHSLDDAPPSLPVSETVRLLVAHQAFAIGGLITRLPGEPPSAEASHLVKAVLHLITGANLFETLVLNMPATPAESSGLGAPVDRPAWEQDSPTATAREPLGRADLLTWQSRRILLYPDPSGATVSKAAVMAGYRFPSNLAVNQIEPMAAYQKRDVPKNQDPWQPVGFRPERALWRDSSALFQLSDLHKPSATIRWLRQLRQFGYLSRGHQFGLSLLGLSSDRAKVFLWRREDLPLPLAYIDDENLVASLAAAIQSSVDAGHQLRLTVWALAAETLGPDGTADRKRVADLVESLAPGRAYWPSLDEPFRRLMRELAATYAEDHGAAAREAWAMDIRIAALQAFEAAASALETSSRGYRAAALARSRFTGAVAGAVAELLPVKSQEAIP